MGSEDDIKQLLQQGLVLQMRHGQIEVTYLRACYFSTLEISYPKASRLKEQVLHVNLISFIRLHVEIYQI